ncbi:Lamin-like protein [Apostasia shenzhenica]|uniref:Lamin-like protein n=1 Tax=Apostasia shenzhenica TaxID=1088818 RepID=A0A2I0ADN7_9ASPA|nr:Lamin-like protein [Apostasia shenzhenica]
MRPPHFIFLLLSLALVPTVAPRRSLLAAAEVHEVGGHEHWANNVNYTDWAAGENFHRGDWLVFHFQKGMYDVVRVNSTDYDRCSADHPISNWSRGHSYAFQLNETGRYYFICSRGYCWGGMKLALLVVEERCSAAPAPSPLPSGSGRFTAPSTVTAAVAVAGAGVLAWPLAAGSLGFRG